VHTNRFGETFQRQFTEALIIEGQAAGHGFVGGALQADPTRWCKLLNALSQHYPGSGHRLIGDDDLAERYPYPDFGADRMGCTLVVLLVDNLKRERSTYCIRGSLEFCDERIAPALVRDAPERRNDVGQAAKRVLEALVRKGFILLYQSGRIDYVGVQNNGQFRACSHESVSTVLSVADHQEV
jgi:hypothetical protein